MNHTLNHYIIGALAVALGAAGVAGTMSNGHRLDVIPHAQVSHFAWLGLTDTQSAALIAALAAQPKTGLMTIWCSDANCSDLAEDLQYAAYQAGWDTHSDRPIYNSDAGLNVGMADATKAKTLAAAIQAATGIKTGTIAADAKAGVNIVIGSR